MNHDGTSDSTTQGVTILDAGESLFRQVEIFAQGLFRPDSIVQLGIIIALFLVAHVLRMIFGPRFHAWVRSRENLSKSQLRWLVVIHKRLRGLFFLVLIWAAVAIMQEIYRFPSRFFLVQIAANLATAWLVVAFATRLIKNGFVRKIVTWGAWGWVTLRIVGVTEQAQTLLDSAAVSVGETRLSLWLLLQAFVFIGGALAVARLFTSATSERLHRNEEISPSMRVLAIKALQVLFYGAAFFFGMNALGIDLTGLAVLSGAIGVGLGFGLQKVVSNLVSGVIILLDKSIKPGDVISLGETFGWINSLGARYVSVVTRDGKEYLIPNEDLITGQVVNWSHSNDFVRLDIFFGTAYGDDPHKVRALAIEAAQRVDRVLAYPKTPVCHVVGFGDSSVDYILRFWISDPTGGLTNIRGAVFLALWDAFKENDISIPFPQREVKMLGDGDPAQQAILD